MSHRTWVEGKNVRYEDPHADNRAERLPALAAELVRLEVDIIVSGGTRRSRKAAAPTRRSR
jgi:hypothetical protein